MTRDEILLNPGDRKLDLEVAVKVMGWTVTEDGQAGTPDSTTLAPYLPIPHFSTSIYAAWDVLEKLHPTHKIGLWTSDFDNSSGWSCRISSKGQDLSDYALAHGSLASLAICRSALLAKMAEE